MIQPVFTRFYITTLVLALVASSQLSAQINPLQKALEKEARIKARDAKNDAKFFIEHQKENLSGTASERLKGEGMPSQAKIARVREDPPPPKMAELIEDPQTIADIENSQNKGRFVRFLGEWWSLPSDADLKLRAEMQARLNALKEIDSTQYRFNRKVTGTDQEIIIFGWHLAAHGSGIVSAYNYQRLTAVSYFSYDINPYTGEPRNPEEIEEFKTGEFTAKVQKQGSFALLSVACDGEESTDVFLDWRNEVARRRVTDSIVRMLATTNSDGIELHFPNVPEYRKDDFVKFVKVLSMSLRAIQRDSANPSNRYRILLSVPANDPYNIYDLGQLEPYIDYAIILGYNFHRQPDGTIKKVPVAPLNYNPVDPAYDIRAAVEKYVGNLGRARTHRLILALPLFGSKWSSQGPQDDLIELMSYMDIKMNPSFQDTLFLRLDSMKTSIVWELLDTTGKSAGVPSTLYSILFDDVWSLGRKYDYIIDARLGGVGFWALGHAIGFAPLDSLLDERFSEFIIPKDDRQAKLEAGSSRVRSYSAIALAVLLYWSIFMACGFCVALLDWKTRQALFTNGRFRLFYLGFFTVLLILIGANLGLFEGTSPALLLGVLLGSLVAWLALKLLYKQQASQP